MRTTAVLPYLLGVAGAGVMLHALSGRSSANTAPPAATAAKPGKYTPEQAAKALRVYVTQAAAVDWGTLTAPNPLIKAAQADMLQLTADGVYGPATQKRGAALTGSAWPSRPAGATVTVKKAAAASARTTIPSNKVAVTSNNPKAASAKPVVITSTTPAAAGPSPTPPPGTAAQVVPTERTTKQSATALLAYVQPIIRSGRGAELGSAAKPNDTVASCQRDMKLIASDGIYGPATMKRGKELLGVEFPSRYGTGTRIPAASVLNRAPAVPPVTTTSEQARAAEGLLTYLQKPRADQGAKGRPSSVIKAAQSAMGQLTADGIYGPATRARGAQLTGKTFPPRK